MLDRIEMHARRYRMCSVGLRYANPTYSTLADVARGMGVTGL